MLSPWAKNPKPIEAKDVRELARAIRRFGFGPPIVARRANGELIAGHLRLAAAKHLRLKEVPVRFMDLSAEEAHAMAIADTQLSQRRKFTKDALASVLEELEEAGTDLTLGTGFDEDAIDKILGGMDIDLPVTDTPVLRERFIVQVECKDEATQVELLERLGGEGLEVKALVS